MTSRRRAPFDVDVIHRRDVQRQELRHQQAADDRQPERPARFGARAEPERNRQRADQRAHRRHHDRPEAHQTRFVNRFERRLAVLALGDRREVHHHDAVLLHEADEHDDADERVQTEFAS